ncbi:hypothetical protein AVEN_139563-1 [Araneus ventricosus]|uniref:Uncharacterized protein n=1 Tax=Araneus ventricosus TaxID=182803 RepID=A0A4Y2WP25_ARAVE|nr:hypothetical protein AVEN_139563-1 [Araneus ventricosus]
MVGGTSEGKQLTLTLKNMGRTSEETKPEGEGADGINACRHTWDGAELPDYGPEGVGTLLYVKDGLGHLQLLCKESKQKQNENK